jgi:hypothetical protein
VIGDEADVFAAEGGEFLGFEDVEARLNPANVAPLGFRVFLRRNREGHGENAGQERTDQREKGLAEGAVQTADGFHSFQ